MAELNPQIETKLTSKKPAPLAKGEWFDHVNGCEVKAVQWFDGDAYCPECGMPGCVYTQEGCK